MIVQCERGGSTRRPEPTWTADVVFTVRGERLSPVRVKVGALTVQTAAYRAVLQAKVEVARGKRVDGVDLQVQGIQARHPGRAREIMSFPWG